MHPDLKFHLFRGRNQRLHLLMCVEIKTFPIGSMYGIFTYIWLIFMVNVGKYTIHAMGSDCISKIHNHINAVDGSEILNNHLGWR